jgi:hypothetical protein
MPPPVEAQPMSALFAPPPPEAIAALRPAPAAPPRPAIGVTLGLLTLPRPVQVEATYRGLDWLSLSAQLSMLPDLTVPALDASLQLRAYQGVARWFPFKGSFFLGSGVGYQTFKASLGKTVDDGKLIVTADLSGLFVSPQLGWLWVWKSGFALGLTLGVQIPLPKEPGVPATYNGQPVPSQPTAGVSQEVIDEANDAKESVRTLARIVSKYPIPNIDLLRIGFFF